jgi:hypothetical protein
LDALCAIALGSDSRIGSTLDPTICHRISRNTPKAIVTMAGVL